MSSIYLIGKQEFSWYNTLSPERYRTMVWYDKEWENPLYWFDKLLVYSDHATFRTLERDLPFVDFLPVDSKFLYRTLKKDVYSLTFETTVNFRTIHIAINSVGKVMTVYPKVLSRADEFQYKYNRYLGAFKPPVDYLPTITADDLVDDLVEGTVC